MERKEIELEVVIVGGGFAGVYCAKRLAQRLGARSHGLVGLVSEENYMVFQPMLPEVAGASVSPRHVVNPLRLLCEGVQVLKGEVEAIYPKKNYLVLNAGAFSGNLRVRFQHLVVALGATVDLSRIPGMPEHSYLVQNVGDAMYLRSTIISRIEEANLEPREEVKRRLLSFVVVGGGYSGAETAGQILDLFRSIHIYYPNVSWADLHVYLVHSRDHLLPTLNRKLGEYCGRKLEERGLRLILNNRVRAVTANEVYLSDGQTISTNTVISTVGNAPHPLVVDLCQREGLPNDKGRIRADEFCRVVGQEKIWAAGDCASVPYVEGGMCPATAQFAMRQGELVAENLVLAMNDQPLKRFTFKRVGEMASIGHRVAVAEIYGVNFSGFFAWWLWRTVYLAKLPRIDRKIRVMIDWTLDLFFPRDINLLSPRHSTLFKEVHLEPGDYLFRQEEPAFSFYIVRAGCIELRDNVGVVQTAGSGDYFGERALLADGVWHFDAIAREPTTLVSIPAKIFHQMVRGSGSLGRLFQRSATKYQSREIVESITKRISDRIGDSRASDIMHRDVQVLRPEMSVSEAMAITKEEPHSSYPFVDRQGKLLGVIHREDFYDFIKLTETHLETRLEKLTPGALPMVEKDATVDEIMEGLIRNGSNKVLVVDGDHRVEGIVTVMDLMTAEVKTELSEEGGGVERVERTGVVGERGQG